MIAAAAAAEEPVLGCAFEGPPCPRRKSTRRVEPEAGKVRALGQRKRAIGIDTESGVDSYSIEKEVVVLGVEVGGI